MSARVQAPAARGRELARTSVLVAAGSLLIVLRIGLLALSPEARGLAYGALFAGLLAACLLVPVTPGRRHLPAALVIAVGAGAIVAALLAAGHEVPAPYGPWTLPLAVLAAVAEEALFRRVAYAALEPYGPGLAIAVTAALFALIHVPLYGVAVLPVDLGAGLLFGWQRWASGSWGAPAATHALANVLAVLAR